MTRQVCLWMGMSVLICGFVSAQARQMTAFQRLSGSDRDMLPIQPGHAFLAFSSQ